MLVQELAYVLCVEVETALGIRPGLILASQRLTLLRNCLLIRCQGSSDHLDAGVELRREGRVREAGIRLEMGRVGDALAGHDLPGWSIWDRLALQE